MFGRSVAAIDPAPAGVEDLLLHLQIEWANLHQKENHKANEIHEQ